MMKTTFLMLLCLVLPSFSLAQEQGEKSDFDLMRDAVVYAAQADAYSVYCGKPGQLAEGFLGKFKTNKRASEKQLVALHKAAEKNKSETIRILQKGKKECKDLELMLARLQIMRALKDTSFLLNGVAPEDIPKDNIPDLEQLMPPRSAPLPEL